MKDFEVFNHRKLFIKESPVHGVGIFARKNIKKGEIIFIIKGKHLRWNVKDQKTSLAGPDWIGTGHGTWIDPQLPASRVNHSCEPNAGIKGRLTVVALKNIKKGSEVTIDYSITEEDKLWYMLCKCKSGKCRKVIRSIHSLHPKIFRSYMPHIPHHFRKVYIHHMNNVGHRYGK